MAQASGEHRNEKTVFLFRIDRNFLGSKPTSTLFCITVNPGLRAGVAFCPLPAAPQSFGQHAVLCCHLPRTGGERERAGENPACRNARSVGRGAPSHVAAQDGWRYSALAPRRPLSLSRSRLSTHVSRGRLPELSAPSAVPGRPVGGRKRKCLLAALSSPRVAAAGRAMEHVTEGSWESLPVPLHPRVLGALRQLGFPHMTPVQVPGAARGRRPSVRGGRWGKAGSSRPGTR